MSARGRWSLWAGSASPKAPAHRRARRGGGTSGPAPPRGWASPRANGRARRRGREAEGAGFPARPLGAWRELPGRRRRPLLRERAGRGQLLQAGGRARGAVGGRRVSCHLPPSATMPGIDKLPIEETLEDSPQVRRGRRGKEQGGPTPGPGPLRPQVPAPAQVGAVTQCPRPSRAAPRAAAARPPAWGPRGPARLGREPRAGSRTSEGGDRASAAFACGPCGHVCARGSLVFDERCIFIAVTWGDKFQSWDFLPEDLFGGNAEGEKKPCRLITWFLSKLGKEMDSFSSGDAGRLLICPRGESSAKPVTCPGASPRSVSSVVAATVAAVTWAVRGLWWTAPSRLHDCCAEWCRFGPNKLIKIKAPCFVCLGVMLAWLL